ncbi:unnamed protein product [Penicillium crustosum]
MASTPGYTPRAVLDAFYEAERAYMSSAPEARDFSGIAATLAPDVRLEQTPALPYAGVYIGPQGIQDWSTRMGDYFDIVDVQNPEIFERPGSDRVVVLSNVHLRAFTVDLEKGLILEIRPFYWDVAAVNAALGY